mgnify:CR=1 FL=1
MKKSYKITFFYLVSFLITIYLFLAFGEKLKRDNEALKYLKSLFSYEQKQTIKKYFFPYKYSSELNTLVKTYQKQIAFFEDEIYPQLVKLELSYNDSLDKLKITRSKIKLSNNQILNKYKIEDGFVAGIHNLFPGSGYIDFYENRILVLSSRGILTYTDDIDENHYLKIIKTNINEYINIKQFEKKSWFSLKDLFIQDNKIFISYTEEIEENCWNTSVIYGDINLESIKFKKLFSANECVHSIKNIDNQFNALQSGGKIILFDDKNILLSIGDYRSRFLAQDRQSVNGKIIKINIESGNYKIISMGHRNPQGLYYDEKHGIIIEAEHGPMGGDEINLISVNKIKNNEILNYGWPVSSYGEHYGGKKAKKNIKDYEKYPLYKSHSEHGFIEPLKSFVPSIGIMSVVKVGEKKYVIGSAKTKALYFFELNEQNKIVNINKIEVYERVRDIKLKKNKLYLFLENTASIGVINLN